MADIERARKERENETPEQRAMKEKLKAELAAKALKFGQDLSEVRLAALAGDPRALTGAAPCLLANHSKQHALQEWAYVCCARLVKIIVGLFSGLLIGGALGIHGPGHWCNFKYQCVHHQTRSATAVAEPMKRFQIGSHCEVDC